MPEKNSLKELRILLCRSLTKTKITIENGGGVWYILLCIKCLIRYCAAAARSFALKVENMKDNARISVSIVTYNDRDRVKNTIETLFKFSSEPVCIYVVDNASDDGTPQMIAERFPAVNIIKNGENVGFGKAHNAVIRKLTSEYHIVSNPDIVLNDDAVLKLADYLDKTPDAVMVSPKILFPDGSEQHLPKRKPRIKYLLAGRLPLKKIRAEYTRENEHLSSPTEIEFCSGCFFMIRTDAFKKLGGFDDRFFMYMEDADISDRARQLGKIIYYPDAVVTHIWERSSSKSLKYLFIHICSAFKYFFGRRKACPTNK